MWKNTVNNTLQAFINNYVLIKSENKNMISNDVLNSTNNAYITYGNYNSVIIFYSIIR